MKSVILYWTNKEMFVVSDTENDSDFEIQKRANNINISPGVIGVTIADESEVPDFAINVE